MVRQPHVAGIDPLGLFYVLLVFSIAFFPLLLKGPGSSKRESDSDSDDDPGKGPPDPPPAPKAPQGDTPLPDAEPARIRLRDHGRLAHGSARRPRRPGRDPDPGPARKLG